MKKIKRIDEVKKMGKVRLADIAKKVGVSTVTVHNALAGNKGVSEELREKIQSVASEMGYQILSERKQKAREAAGEASYTVGVLIAENYLAQYETFYWKMYQELAVAATEKRCFAAVEILRKEDERNTLKLPACVEGNKVDGLIVLGKINKEYIVKLTETARIPVVSPVSPPGSGVGVGSVPGSGVGVGSGEGDGVGAS